MKRITATQHAKAKDRPAVRQLGSTQAVLAKLPDDGVLIVATRHSNPAEHLLQCRLGGPGQIRIIAAGGGPAVLYELPPETVVGVDVNAFDGIPTEVWADMQRVLERRFAVVHWG